jgi:hypothetical protein
VQASSAGVQQQLESSKTIHCPAIFAAKTIEYQPCGKAVPELMNVAMGRRPRPPKVNQFAAAFRGRWRKTGDGCGPRDAGLLKRFSRDPGVAKARLEFERAQRVEERFHKDFDALNFTSR